MNDSYQRRLQHYDGPAKRRKWWSQRIGFVAALATWFSLLIAVICLGWPPAPRVGDFLLHYVVRILSALAAFATGLLFFQTRSGLAPASRERRKPHCHAASAVTRLRSFVR